jgi:hypothetical protein
MLRPYDVLGKITNDLNQTMNMVRHDDKTIQSDDGKMIREFRPTGSDDIAVFIARHTAIIDPPEYGHTIF